MGDPAIYCAAMLVGREREMAEIRAALSRLSAGTGALILLAGEPGIGKSRLAAEAVEAARALGVTPAWGRCWEAGGAPAFWPWLEACAALDVPFPEPGAIAVSDPGEARFALFRDVASALARAAAERPLLIVLEDVHAADASTLVLLEFVADRLRSMSVAVIATYRDVEASLRADASRSIARLGRAGRALTLPRLGAGDVASLVRETIEGADQRLVENVFATTQGNPLFVDEVVRDIRAHGERSGLPLGVREVIRQRLGLLSPEARVTLEAGAVLGVEFAGADLESMLPDAAALDEASRSGVLVPVRERLRFSHALYREALYFDLSSERRRALHREAARALSAREAPLAELAHHFLEAGTDFIAGAVDHAIRAAAHAAETFAFEDALALLERARASVRPGPQAKALLCRVSIALGETELQSGDAAGRARCAEAAATARELGDAELLAEAGLAYGSVFLMGGVDPVLVGILEEAFEALPAADSALRARVMARLAAARQPSPRAERTRDIDLGLDAIAMARRVASRRELLGVLHSASGVLYGAVHPAVRSPISREQAALAEELGDTKSLMHARVRLAYDCLEQGDYASYADLAAQYEQFAARIGPEAAPWRVPLMRSMLALNRDDYAASERWQAEAKALDAGQPRARRAQAFHRLGFLRATERHAELRAALPELRGLWLAMPYGGVLAEARVAQVLARIGAEDELRALLARLPEAVIEEEINHASLADAIWATADAALAARLLPPLAALHDRWQPYWFDCEMVDAPNDRALAYLSLIVDRWDEAERRFARALAAVQGVGRRSLAARMRFELGDLLRRKGRELERARELISSARGEASALGLSELVSLIDRRHPDVCSAPEQSSPPHPAPSAPRSASVASPPARSLVLEGEYYALAGTHGTLRFKASRGMQYLASLLARPNTEIHVLDLVGAGDHVDRSDSGEVVDAAALAAYRARLEALREQLEIREELGDREAAQRVREEMESLAAELGRSTQKGGRARRTASAVDRARSAVQRRIKDALDRIAERDPELGGRLRRAVRTGNSCSYRPSD